MTGGLTRERILRGRRHFLRVREQGLTERSFLLSLGVLAVAQGSGLKVGFVTPKHLGKAHDRNRIRRRLKEIVRLGPLPDDAPFWLVLVARHPAAAADYPELQRHWVRLARRAGLPGFDPVGPNPLSPP